MAATHSQSARYAPFAGQPFRALAAVCGNDSVTSRIFNLTN